jgi:hypothetical protein
MPKRKRENLIKTSNQEQQVNSTEENESGESNNETTLKSIYFI